MELNGSLRKRSLSIRRLAMRKLMGLLWTVVIVGILLSSGGLAFQNEPGGFGGLEWGDPPKEDMVWDNTDE